MAVKECRPPEQFIVPTAMRLEGHPERASRTAPNPLAGLPGRRLETALSKRKRTVKSANWGAIWPILTPFGAKSSRFADFCKNGKTTLGRAEWLPNWMPRAHLVDFSARERIAFGRQFQPQFAGLILAFSGAREDRLCLGARLRQPDFDRIETIAFQCFNHAIGRIDDPTHV